MIKAFMQPKEKKVEYVELIYDLIFVYIIGRNNQLLHSFENGFIAWPAFMAYIMTTLAIIQIWNYIEMLETVAQPFLMGNAPEELKERFHHVTFDNDHEGIYMALKKMGVIGSVSVEV